MIRKDSGGSTEGLMVAVGTERMTSTGVEFGDLVPGGSVAASRETKVSQVRG